MSDDSDPRRNALHSFLQEQGPAIDNPEKHAVLVGWAIVLDWMDEDGDRWLSKAHSASLPSWLASGLHHEALFGTWPDAEDDDEN